MLKQIKQWLKPPVFPSDEEKTAQARILNTIGLYFVVTLLTAAFILVPFFVQHKIEAWAIILAFSISFGVSRHFLFRGQLTLSVALIITSVWVAGIGVTLISGGIGSAMLLVVMAATIFIGFLLEPRIGTGFVFASALAGLGMAILQQNGISLPDYFFFSPISTWFIFALALLFVHAVMNLIVRHLQGALTRERQQNEARQQVEATLRESERKFRKITENIPGMVYQFRVRSDGSTYFSYISPRATELFGLPTDLNIPDWELGARVHPDDRESFFASVTQAIENMTTWNYEGRLFTPTDEEKWFQGVSSPVQTDNELVFDGILLDITKRKQAEEMLQDVKNFAENLIQTANVIFVQLNNRGEVIRINETAEEIIGYSRSELEGVDWFDLLVPRERYPYVWKEFLRMTERGFPKVFENPIITKSGEERYIMWQNGMVYEKGEIIGAISFGVDITERKQTEERLRESERAYRSLVQNLAAGVVVHAPDTRIILANEHAASLLGLDTNQLMGKEVIDAAWHFLREDGTPMPHEEYPVTQVIATQTPVINMVAAISHLCTEEPVWVLINAFPEFDSEDRLRQVVVTFMDITQRKQAEEALWGANKILQAQLDQINTLHETLREQAIRDPLTGLHNRRYLNETIEREIARAKRESHPISFMIVDIDLFKEFNDSYGHDFGDEVLITLSALLHSNVRMGDIACRYGGDEFVVVMPGASAEDAEHRAETLRQDFSTMQLKHGGIEVTATLSIGISIYPQHGDNGDNIFQCADAALYQAKEAGRNQVQVWKGE